MIDAAQEFSLAFASYLAGDLADAEFRCRHVLRVDLRHIDALHLLGLIALRLGLHEEVERHLGAVLRLRPDFAEVHSNLGVSLRARGRLAEAEDCFRRAAELKPGFLDAWNNLGNVRNEQRKYAEAISTYDEILRVHPECAETHNYMGITRQAEGKLADAVECHRRALGIKPTYAEAYRDLGFALRELGRLEEAADAYQQAIRLRPDYAEAHNNLAMLRLLQGDFANGWPEFEWRWRTGTLAPRGFSQPRWDGGALAGRTILLHAEQGLGDVFQMIRYAPLVKRRGGRVVVECFASLLPVLANCGGVDQWISGEPLPAFDVYAPLMSLPGLCGTTLATIPAEIPYISVDPNRVERWRTRLDATPGFKVGICWQGSTVHKNDHRRSVPLSRFAALAEVAGVQLVSLQLGFGAEQIASAGFEVRELADRTLDPGESWLDTAAILCALDLVIAVDTSVAHLAGVMGRPVWVLLPFAPDWRWLLGREDSPWYPTMRLFRQKQSGDWAELFGRVAERLRSSRSE